VWNGFKGIGSGPALVANCSTIPHDPEEIVRMDPFTLDVPYDWSLRHG
jgi:dTDP-4-dehydrorhamnose 3,5-epimerase